MGQRDLPTKDSAAATGTCNTATSEEPALFRELVDAPVRKSTVQPGSVHTGILLAVFEAGCRAVVRRGDAPIDLVLNARSTIDLHGGHIGRSVVLAYEDGDPTRPIVMGLLRDGFELPTTSRAGSVDISADGARLVVSATRELVLRCGKASITLDCEGRLTLRGETIVSQAAGANHVRGGSVELN